MQKHGDIIIHQQVQICTSKYDSYFNGIVYGTKGLLLVFGAFLAWETRKVRFKDGHDCLIKLDI